jgi:hypothetical protein
MRLGYPALLATFLTTGCSFTSTTVLPIHRSASGDAVAPNMVMAPMIGGEALGYSQQALATRISLVRMDAEATCFDLLMPLPSDGTSLSVPLELHAEVDDVDAAVFQGAVDECSAARPCLPPDSPLQSYAREPDGNVLTLGQRVCFPRLPRAHRSLALGRRGVFAWRFRFVFTADPG